MLNPGLKKIVGLALLWLAAGIPTVWVAAKILVL